MKICRATDVPSGPTSEFDELPQWLSNDDAKKMNIKNTALTESYSDGQKQKYFFEFLTSVVEVLFLLFFFFY